MNNEFKNASSELTSQALVMAAKNKDVELANYLLTSQEVKNKPNLRKDSFGALRYAAYNNDLDMLELLINSPSFKSDKKGQDALNYSLGISCFYGHLDVVKFLLNSPKITYKPHIANKDNEALSLAISSGNFEVVKYMLVSTDLEVHADIFSKKWDVISRCLNINEKANDKILKFVVFDLNIPKDKNIDKIIKNNPGCVLEKYFEMRELNNSLCELEVTQEKIHKKIKV